MGQVVRVACPQCMGLRFVEGDEPLGLPCPVCRGKGYIWTEKMDRPAPKLWTWQLIIAASIMGTAWLLARTL